MKEIHNLKFTKRTPTLSEFRDLRINAGWKLPSEPMMTEGLEKSLFGICVETPDEKTIGIGRVVGDGGIQFFITDVIVHKEWQNQGLGTQIMILLMEYIHERASPGSFVGLFSAFGREKFYEKFGFIVRPNVTLGPGMVYYPPKTDEKLAPGREHS